MNDGDGAERGQWLKKQVIKGTGKINKIFTKNGAQSTQFSEDLVQMSVVTAQMSLGV